MTRYPEPERALRTITPPTPAPDRPALFHPWPDDVKTRCRELWSSVGNRNAPRVEWLYSREVPEGTAIPASVTIRQWARDEDWEAWANGELVRTKGKTLHHLQVGWLRALQLSQETQIDAMLGAFDGNPGAGAVRIKAAESVQRIVAQAGLLALLPAEPEEPDEERLVSLPERARRMREKFAAENTN